MYLGLETDDVMCTIIVLPEVYMRSQVVTFLLVFQTT